MSKQIFINLPVVDIEKAENFYNALGFENNPQFSDENGKCMVWSDSIFVMLLSHAKFLSFTQKALADSKSKIAAIFSLSTHSEEEMNKIVQNGLSAGGTEPTPIKDYGFMQQRTLEDIDGHIWEIFYMDLSKFPAH